MGQLSAVSLMLTGSTPMKSRKAAQAPNLVVRRSRTADPVSSSAACWMHWSRKRAEGAAKSA